jgi:prolyl-tRNA synthetase
MFGKTNKTAKEFDSINATLLQKAGYIDQVMAGVYTYLPLGLRVLGKIEAIIRTEMNKIATEVLMPALAPRELWEKTGRIKYVDVLMQTVGANPASLAKNNSSYILNSTHEELVTPLAKKYTFSYKQLPLALYQIQTKFRNEPRAKSGLLRCREFRMKDLYSFNRDEDDLKSYYEVVKQSYMEIFKQLGIGDDTVIAMASGGDFTDDFSHEFQTRCEAGEDLIFHAKKAAINYNKEIAPSLAPEFDQHDEQQQPLQEVEGKGLIGVKPLAEFLKIPVEKTTKTMFYEVADGQMIAVAVRGDYEVNELKLKKVAGSKILQLASAELIKTKTGAEVGYAGVLNLPADVKIYFDESCKDRINFETGANKTDFHIINVNFGRDLPLPGEFFDLKVAKEGDIYPDTHEVYEVFKGSEVGNIFPLYTKFTDDFDFKYIDEAGKAQKVYMGCYGMGPSRIMGVLVEKFHDDKGIVWPKQVAPYQIHLIGLNLEDLGIKEKAEQLYHDLKNSNIEVLYDDRNDINAGEKFRDADLIGIPVRVVISRKSLDNDGQIELKNRNSADSLMLKCEASAVAEHI